MSFPAPNLNIFRELVHENKETKKNKIKKIKANDVIS